MSCLGTLRSDSVATVSVLLTGFLQPEKPTVGKAPTTHFQSFFNTLASEFWATAAVKVCWGRCRKRTASGERTRSGGRSFSKRRRPDRSRRGPGCRTCQKGGGSQPGGSEPVDRRARVALKRRHEGAVIGHKEVRRGRCARGFRIGDSGFRIRKFQMAKSRCPHRSSISRWRLRTTCAGFNIFADRRDPARMPTLALAPRAWTEHGSDQQRNG